MKIVLAAGVLGLLFGYAVGAAQTGSRFGGFAEFKGMSCWSWVPATSQLKEGDLVGHAPEHAWTYGFVSGAAYMSPVRLRSLNAGAVDHWIDEYCAAHRGGTVGGAVQALAQELAKP